MDLDLSEARELALDELMLPRHVLDQELIEREYMIDERTGRPYRDFFMPLRRLRYLVLCSKTRRDEKPPKFHTLKDDIEINGRVFSRKRFYKQPDFQKDLDAAYFALCDRRDSFCKTEVDTTRKGMPYLRVEFPVSR